MTDKKGGPPRVAVVEQPHDIIRLWARDKVQGRTLVLISANIGIMSTDEDDNSTIDALAAKGDWDGLLAKTFPTARHYPVNAYNYLYAAHRAGIISEVYWTPPTRSSVGQEPIQGFKEYLAGQGVSDRELDALRQDKDSINGTLNGVPVHIYSLKDLPKMKQDVLLAIDLSIFTPNYQDEVKTPMLDMFAGFIATLGDKKIPASDAAVSLSTAFGPVPLEYRFLGRYVYTYLTDPASLKTGPPHTWQLRSQAMYNALFAQYDENKAACEEAVKSDPEDASLWYDLAVAYLGDKDVDKFKGSLDKAVALDKGYYPSYIEFGKYFASKDMPGEAEAFLKEAVRVNPDDPRGYNGLHNLYFNTGNYGLAADELLKVLGMGFDGPENLAALADTYQKQKLYDKAEKYYIDALAKIPQVDSTARLGIVLKLADAYEADRKIQKALTTLHDALNTTDDPHSRQQIQAKADAVKAKWGPFLNPVPQTPSR